MVNEKERLFNSFSLWQLASRFGIMPTEKQKEEAYERLGNETTFRGSFFLMYLEEIIVRDEFEKVKKKKISKQIIK